MVIGVEIGSIDTFAKIDASSSGIVVGTDVVEQRSFEKRLVHGGGGISCHMLILYGIWPSPRSAAVYTQQMAAFRTTHAVIIIVSVTSKILSFHLELSNRYLCYLASEGAKRCLHTFIVQIAGNKYTERGDTFALGRGNITINIK